MNIHYFSTPISDAERAKILFEGDLIIHQQVTPLQGLIDYACELLSEYFEGLEPTRAQGSLSKDDFLFKCGEVQRNFRTSETPKQLFFEALAFCGMQLEHNYYDHFPMRVVPLDNTHRGGQRAAIGHHRDTWGSNIHSQMNWWAPLFSLEAERTIAIYPDYWEKPLSNNTATWSFEEFLLTRSKGESERQIAYPSALQPMEPVDESGVIKVVLQPGELLNFSSAHLHASVPNTTQETRFSVEMRTFNSDDIKQSKAAPNIDNAASTPMYGWFKSIKSRKPFCDNF